MQALLAIALSFPSVVFTVLLVVSLIYWVFVMIGAARVNLFGDGAIDGALDGAAKGALEGVADHFDPSAMHHAGIDGGGMDGGGADGGGADGGDVGDVDQAGGAGGHHGLPGMLASLRLRSAPATVVLSSLVLFSWLFSVMGMQAANALLSGGVPFVARLGVFVLAPLLALPVTSIVIRPLARVFVTAELGSRAGLVGKVCVIRTGVVTDRFGEAILQDGGAGVVVRVRVDAGEKLARGDQAIIVGYDDESQEFTVAPFDDGQVAPRRRASR